MKQKNEHFWLSEAPVNKAIWHMAIPMMLGMSVNIIYNITDTFFIGKLNDTSALAAITLLLPYTTVLMAIGNLFGTGGSTLFARLIGHKQMTKAKQCCATTFWLSLLAGVLATIFSLIFYSTIIKFLGGDSSTFILMKQYLICYAIGAPFVVANFTLEQLTRGNGSSITSMLGMIISVGINILFDPIFIFGFNLGMSGAAFATILGNIAAVGYYIFSMQKKTSILSVTPQFIKLEKNMLKEIFSVGISAMLLDILLIFSSLLFNFYSLQYGNYVLAGFGISQKLVQIVDLVGMGLYLGVIPLIAVAYGANNIKRMKAVIHQTSLYLMILISILFSIMFTARHTIIHCFSNNPEIIRIGGFILTIQLFSAFFAAGAGLLTGIFQAKGQGKQAIIMSITRGLILIPAIIVGNQFFAVNGVICSLIVAEAFSCLTGLALYQFDKTKVAKVTEI